MKPTLPSQTSFAQAEYAKKKKRTRREAFLEKMEQVVPWSRLMEVIEPHYPRSGRRGRQPIGLERMLRMYFVQQWYGLADEAVEDATLIAAPGSTKNREHARDPDMHQTKKGNTWHFGMKAHIGVDRESGLVHTLVTTAANVSDISQTPALLHGQEQDVWADAGYVGVEKREDMRAALEARAQEVQWHVAKRRKTLAKLADGWQKDLAQAYEKLKAQVRASVEHPFHIIKNIFKHKKVRYKGLAKNDAQLNVLFALSNLYMVRGQLRP